MSDLNLSFNWQNRSWWFYLKCWSILRIFGRENLLCHKQGGGRGMSINLHTSNRKFFNMAAWLSLEPLIVIVGMNVGFIMWVSSPCFFSKADPWSPRAQLLTGSGSIFISFAHWNKTLMFISVLWCGGIRKIT